MKSLLIPLIFNLPGFVTALVAAGGNFSHPTKHQLIVAGIPSPVRSFFAVIHFDNRDSSVICGGSIVHRQWILTAGHCLAGFKPQDVIVEVGDFTDAKSKRELIRIIRWYFAPNFMLIPLLPNDMALIKLTHPITIFHRVIHLCKDNAGPDTLLATCGMGTTSRLDKQSFPKTLVEAYFKEVKLLPEGMSCRPDNICVKPVLYGSNLCYGDSGGPLYTMHCGSTVPKCLYGVASYVKRNPMQHLENCNAGSFYSSVPLHYYWIQRIINCN